MIATAAARRQQAAPTPRRDLVGFLLLAGIEHRSAPWIGFAGMAACWVLCVILENVL